MSMPPKEPRDELALRKELLLAQSTLYRAKLHHEITTLRSNAFSKSSLFGLLTLAAGSRASGWIAIAGRMLVFARLAKTLIGLFRR